MLIFILCLATFFNTGGRILHFFGFQQFIGDAEVTQELIEDGKNLVQRGQYSLIHVPVRYELISDFLIMKKNVYCNVVTAN
jgi:hypothetical protein